MSQFPYSYMASGSYTNDSPAVARNIPLSDRPDLFIVKDMTNWGAASTAVPQMQSEWNRTLAQGSYIQTGQTSAGAGSNFMYGKKDTSGGFTFIDQANPPTFANVAVSAVTGTTTWVVSTGTTDGINVGDYIRLINILDMQQFSGPNLYQVTAVSAGVSITLGYAATAKTAGMVCAANGTTGYYKKVIPELFYPASRPIAHITQAAQAKVYFFRTNDFTPGQLVDFQIPTDYGMTQLSNLAAQPRGPVRVLSVTNSASESSITLDIDSTGFTAFTIPATASFVNSFSPATCMPAGSGIVPLNGSATVPQSPPGTNLVDAFDNRNQYVMQLGTNVVGAANATMFWTAWKADGYNYVTNA